jgi:glutaminase
MKKIFSLDFYTGLQAHSKTVPAWVPYDETEEVTCQCIHKKCNTKLSNQNLDKNDIWKNISQISDFSEDDYQRLKPLILENIPPFNPIFNLGALAMKH